MKILKQPEGARIVLLATCFLFVFACVCEWIATTKAILKRPSVELLVSKTVLTYPCQSGWYSSSHTCPISNDIQVNLTANTDGFHQQSLYAYTVTGGRVRGTGSSVTWDLSEAGPGSYSARVDVEDRKKHRAASTVWVTVAVCGDCIPREPCFPLTLSCYDEVLAGTPVTCTLRIWPGLNASAYVWSTRDWDGTDLKERISGRGNSISIRTEGLGGRHLRTTVNLKGLDPSCNSQVEASTKVKP